MTYSHSKKKFPDILAIFFILFIFVTPVFIAYNTLTYYKTANENWIKSQGLQVKTDETQLLCYGPYYPLKGTTIYKVVTKDQRIFWIRLSIMGMEIQELTKDGYKQPIHAERND